MADEKQALGWLNRLYPKLQERAREIQKPEDYYNGKQPLAFATVKYREEFGRMLAELCDNWMPLVVDAVEERLHVEGFRFGDDTAGDKDAWTIWQRNKLDADSELGHSTALTTGWGPVMVWAGKDGLAEITVEHPSQVLVAYESGTRRTRSAAIKAWVDEWTGATFANVYLPDGIYKFRGPAKRDRASFTTQTMLPDMGGSRRWTIRDDTVENPLGVVPVVEMINRPKLVPVGVGRSEIAEVLSTQDQINKLVCDMLVASEFAAFKQRWATGIEVPTDPETGLEVQQFQAAIDRLWHTPNDGAKFGEFTAVELANYVKGIENRVQSLASRTRTPPHYLLGNTGSFPSGESLKATETGLIAKARSRQRHFGETWEEIIRLSLQVEGKPRTDPAAETIWADPESRSESEHVDSLVKKRSLGVPLEQLWEDAGYSPQQIGRFRSMLAQEALLRVMGTPAADWTPSPAPPEPTPA